MEHGGNSSDACASQEFLNIALHYQETSIEEMQSKTLKENDNETIYDLSGCRLSGIPAHGIYIKGGLKITKQ